MIETGPDGVAAHLDIPVDVQGFAPPEEFVSFLKSAEEDSKEASVNNAETNEDGIPTMEYWRRQVVTSKPTQKGRYAIAAEVIATQFPTAFVHEGRKFNKHNTLKSGTLSMCPISQWVRCKFE
mmetsp:Transcript_17552/g.27529  ORF Transcript_17552/g.27529 Transcript_17552/m.27529 type:complete len:123 (-) Transcript_17552:96-464(-)